MPSGLFYKRGSFLEMRETGQAMLKLKHFQLGSSQLKGFHLQRAESTSRLHLGQRDSGVLWSKSLSLVSMDPDRK